MTSGRIWRTATVRRKAELTGRKVGQRDIHGWLAVDKPEAMTSADVVAVAKRTLKARKVGHAGTLDRPATGVLALAFGEATKTIPHVMDSLKIYKFLVRFGQATTTDDATGDVVAESEQIPAQEDVLNALHRFRGNIKQRPPDYSAVKVSGRRASSIAASGEAVELAPRSLRVDRLELVRFIDDLHAEFELHCGKGGYVRSIARDLGEVLGCLAHVRALRRLATGPFQIENCSTLAQINNLGPDAEPERFLLPLEFGLSSFDELKCTEIEAARIRNGMTCRFDPLPNERSSPRVVWVSCSGRAVATGELKDGLFHPRRVFRVETVAGGHAD